MSKFKTLLTKEQFAMSLKRKELTEEEREELKKLQIEVGIPADGHYGLHTLRAIRDYNQKKIDSRNNKIDNLLND